MDGPFAEAKEFISYAQYEVRSKEEAVEWASRFMKIHQEFVPGWEGEAEVLKVFGPEDFGPPAHDLELSTAMAAPGAHSWGPLCCARAPWRA